MNEVGVERQTGLPIRYVLVLWLMVLSAVAYLDRTNISIAGIEISQEFAISKIRLGGIFSAFLIGYAGFQIPAGLLARRLGPRRTLGLLGLWWGFFIALTALIPRGTGEALVILVMIRFALGAGRTAPFGSSSRTTVPGFPPRGLNAASSRSRRRGAAARVWGSRSCAARCAGGAGTRRRRTPRLGPS